ncbi:MAG TPA: type II CAAX endopeptidase family protein [Puia sp.]|nr:type II CAAX endopeptidase family protein [Puia sp.]
MPSPPPTSPDQSKRPLILAGIIIAFSIFLLGSTILTLLLKPAHLGEETILFVSRGFFWICLLAMVAYAIKIERLPFLLWAEKKYALGYYLVSVIAILLILLAGMYILSQVELSLGLLKKSAKLNGMVLVLRRNQWLLALTCLTAGVTEELIFRGYLIPRLQLFFKSPYPALIISSVSFGLAHIGYGNVAQVIGPVFIGFIFALYYQKYRNIKILIICHFLWDYLTLLVMTR